MLKLVQMVVITASCTWAAFVGAQATDKSSPAPGSVGDQSFAATVAREIYKVIPGNKSSFVLNQGEASNPVFPGKGLNDFEQVECEKTAGYKMIGFGNEQGQIGVAVCAKGQRVQDIALKVPARLDALLKNSTAPKKDARALGWYYTHAKLNDRLEFHYFPVIAMGHGVLTAYTGVVFDKATKRAVVVQISPYPMCESFRSSYKDAPLCTDIAGTLEKLAGGIAARFATGN